MLVSTKDLVGYVTLTAFVLPGSSTPVVGDEDSLGELQLRLFGGSTGGSAGGFLVRLSWVEASLGCPLNPGVGVGAACVGDLAEIEKFGGPRRGYGLGAKLILK